MRELRLNPGMPPATSAVQLASVGSAGVGAKEASPSPEPTQVHALDAPGTARAADSAGANLLKATEAMRQVKFQELRADGLAAQRNAQAKAAVGQTDAAIDVLKNYLAGLDEQQLDPAQMSLLRRPVESRLEKFKILKIQEDMAAADAGNKDAVAKHAAEKITAQRNKEEKVAELMKQFNAHIKEGKYAEAQRDAAQAHELDPDNSAATAGVAIARMEGSLTDSKTRRARQGSDGESSAERRRRRRTGGRREDRAVHRSRDGQVDAHPQQGWYVSRNQVGEKREIENKLRTPVTLNFTDAPLKQVIDDIRGWTDINIFVDQQALDQEGVSMERPVSVKLEGVSLKSVLNLVLKQVHLTYIIKDDVLQITSEAQASGKMQRVTYQVADLVIPIPNASASPTMQTGVGAYAPTPLSGPYSLPPGTAVGSAAGGAFRLGRRQRDRDAGATPPQTREEQLIKLITNTIEPRSWSDLGGSGTIDYHPLTMGLVINQTPDIQEQILDLLNSLRRLQDQEVALEVRFISISDDFFERIGVDFALNINTQSSNSKFEPQLTSGVFQPAGQHQHLHAEQLDLRPGRAGGTLTNDLNIPIASNTFLNTIPAVRRLRRPASRWAWPS